MRKVLWLIPAIWLVVILLCLDANATYLACDWQDGVIASEVEVNGVVRAGTVVKDGTDMLLLDLVGYSNGSYVFRARFIGTGGFPSDWSLPFDAVKPTTGGALKIKR